MSDFNPGEGWRKVPDGEFVGGEVLTLTNFDEGATWQRWVREEPVPPLPTEPYTVIRVTWPEGASNAPYVLLTTGVWLDTVLGHRYAPDKFTGAIGVEVLSEPRAVTADAVLDRVAVARDSGQRLNDNVLELIGREFGTQP